MPYQNSFMTTKQKLFQEHLSPAIQQSINWLSSGHVLDLHCVRLYDAAPFAKIIRVYLFFDAEHIEKGFQSSEMNEIFCVLFS